MPSDYEAICRDNIRRRGEEFDDIGRLISEQLYSDRAHFIYELLQNAEDALARRKRNCPESKLPTSVTFLLYKDRLEFRHFGEEFNTDDVKGISDVLKGTKSDDKTQIGRFGIGFKSVYAFTSTPEIHSGDEHFVIERYIRPRSADRIPQMSDGETVFIFPFNHKDLSKERAFQLIKDRLKTLGPRILLFLRHISEIEWKIVGYEYGFYLKESKQLGEFVQQVTVIGQHGEEDEEEEWLVFRRPVDAANSSFGDFVEVAFRLVENKKEKRKIIRKIDSSPLIVYFPTKLETRLGFLVQGPYDTTASRSDIEDNEWNRKLIIETADLLIETVLPWLKDRKLLTTSFLEALPIRPENFPINSLFRPIYEKIRSTLRDQEFLPTADGKYVAGKHAVLARAEDIVDLINPRQLSRLMESPVELKWLTTEITETKKDIHRYLVGWKPRYQWETEEEIKPLIVDEIRPEDIVEKITRDFLQEQSITWLIKFYTFLGKRTALIDSLKDKPIIRLQDGTHVPPFREDGSYNAYLPPESDTEYQTIVSREIVKDERALEFLNKLGLKKPDAVSEVIEHILPKYAKPNPEISKDEHFKDMGRILKAYETDSLQDKKLLTEKLKNTPFIRAENPILQRIEYKEPGKLYFRKKELVTYFDGNKDVWFVSPEYDQYDQDLYNFFKNLGVDDEIWVQCKSDSDSEDVDLGYENGLHKRGIKGFDPDIKADGLEHAITNASVEKSKIIWNKIAVKYQHCIKGKVLISSRQDFSPNASKYEEEELTSSFGRLLMDNRWLPDKRGNFHKPAELELDDLPESFIRDENLANQLGMKKNVVAKLAEEAGISVDTLNVAKELENHPALLEEIKKRIRPTISDKKSMRTEADTDKICYKDELQKSFNRPGVTKFQEQVINTGKVRDPERRREKSYEEHKKRLDQEPKPEERHRETIRTILEGPDEQVREYLFQLYGGKCQICGNTFPERDGKPFFIANYIVPRRQARFVDTPANALCLCADHFARWQHGAVEAEDIIDQICSFRAESEGGNSPPVLKIRLCGEECEIKFKEKHLLDLQELLKVLENDEL